MKYHPFWGTIHDIHGNPIYLGPGSTVTLRHPPSAGYLNSECRNHHFSLISPLASAFWMQVGYFGQLNGWISYLNPPTILSGFSWFNLLVLYQSRTCPDIAWQAWTYYVQPYFSWCTWPHMCVCPHIFVVRIYTPCGSPNSFVSSDRKIKTSSHLFRALLVQFFVDSSLLSTVLLFCFSAFPFVCFSAFLLFCFSAFLLLCFSVGFCFSVFCFLFFCFSAFFAFLFLLLLCFSYFSAFALLCFFCFSVFCFSVFVLCFVATRKGLSSECHRCHAKRDVLSPQCRLTLQNAENIANTTQTALHVVVCFSALFWPWWFRQLSFFLALHSFTGFLTSWLCCVNLFTATQTTIVR